MQALVALLLFLTGAAAHPQPADPAGVGVREREWLAGRAHPLRVGIVDSPPVIAFDPDADRVTGLAADYLRHIESTLKVDIRWLTYADYSSMHAALQRGDIDLVSFAMPRPDREAVLRYSTPFARLRNAIVVAAPAGRSLQAKSFYGRCLAVARGGATADYLRRAHPAINLRETAGWSEALLEVANAHCAGAVIEASQLAYYRGRLGLTGLELAGYLDFDQRLTFAARAEDEPLISAINAVLASMSDAEQQRLADRWFAPASDGAWRTFRLVLAGFVAFGLLAVAWGMLMRREVRRRTRDLEASGRILQQILAEKESILDNALVGIALIEDRRLLTCNRRFSEMVGYREGELRAVGLENLFLPPSDLAALFGPPDRELAEAGRTQLGEVRLVARDGRRFWVEISSSAVRGPAGEWRRLWVVSDVDARKRSEHALRQSERRFQATFDSAVQAIGVLGIDGRILDLNRTARQWLGLHADRWVAMPLWLLPGLAAMPDQPARIRQAVEQAAGGRTVALELQYVGGDGALGHMTLSLKPVADGPGNPLYLLVEGHDVTARRVAVDALQQLAAATSRVVGTDFMAALVEHTCRALNTRHAFVAELAAVGGHARTLAVWDDGNLAANRDLPISGTPLADLLRSGESCHPDGAQQRFPLDVDIQRRAVRSYWGLALRDAAGAPIGFFATMNDLPLDDRPETRAVLTILAGRATQELLRLRTEARLRIAASALEHSREGICIADRQRRILLANPASVDISGRAPGRLEGRVLTCLGGDEYGARSLGEVLDIADHAGRWQGELWVRRADGGEKFPVWLSINRIRHGGDDLYAVLFFDYTRQRKAEEERLRLEANLRQVQRMESVGHLAGGVAHDFNNILTIIGGFTGLARQASARPTERMPGYLDEIELATRRARDLVAQLLAFSRNELPVAESVIIAPIVEEAGKLLRATLPATIELDIRLPAGLPDIRVNPGQLHQAIMNLMLNARDATGGRGRILITATPYRINGLRTCDSCHRHFDGEFVALMVQDNGHGIPAEVRGKIFDPFFTTKPLGQGSGLGLSVLHGVVHGAGGHIEVASAEGAGTTFRLLLPVVPAPVPADGTALPASSVVTLPDRRVIVVDDESAIVQFVTELLRAHGVTASGYTDARKALAALKAAPDTFDLLLTDQTMPHLSGEDLVQEVQALRPDLPVILWTGFSEQIDAPRAASLGVRRFVLKPLLADALLRAVAEALSVPD